MVDMRLMNLNEGNTESVRKLPLFEEFPAVIVESRLVPVGRQQEQSIELVFEAVAGPRKGQRFTRYITIWSRDMQARCNGRTLLHSLFHALGIEPPANSSEMHNRLVVLRLLRERGEEDRPHVQFVHCSMTSHEENRRWLKREGKAFSEHLARTKQESEGKR